jgi:hypothetical protein
MRDVRRGARVTEWFADAAGMILFTVSAIAAMAGVSFAAVWVEGH